MNRHSLALNAPPALAGQGSGARCRQSFPPRAGLTLLEVVISMGVFLGALAVLSQVTWNGTRASVQGRLRAQAIFRCEAKMTEVCTGAELLQSQANTPFPDDPNWTFSVTVGEGAYPELLQIDVSVSHTGNNSLANATYRLRKWMRDPQYFLDAAAAKAEAEAQAEADAASQSSSSSSSSSGSSSSGGAD